MNCVTGVVHAVSHSGGAPRPRGLNALYRGDHRRVQDHLKIDVPIAAGLRRRLMPGGPSGGEGQEPAPQEVPLHDLKLP